MIHTFTGETANDVWLRAVAAFRHKGETCEQSSRAGITEELLHASMTIRDPKQRWIVSRKPPINPAFAIAEVVWILCGRDDSAFLNYWNSKLPKFAGFGDCYHGAYGYRLRKQFGLDQLDRAYRALKENPDSRQIVLQIWDPSSDLPGENGKPVDPDVPCNVCSMLKVRNGRLEWLQILRSNDLFLGVPYNFVQFTCMQEVIAGWLGMPVGEYNHFSDSLHVYESNLEDLNSVKPVNAEINTDSLSVSREDSDRIFTALSSTIEVFTKPDLSEDQLSGLVEDLDIPSGYRNLLLIMAAEAARRRQWKTRSRYLINECSNPALCQIWQNWLARTEDSSRRSLLSHRS